VRGYFTSDLNPDRVQVARLGEAEERRRRRLDLPGEIAREDDLDGKLVGFGKLAAVIQALEGEEDGQS